MKARLTKLQKAILKTIAYFDIFNIPLEYKKIVLYLYRFKIVSQKKYHLALNRLIDLSIIKKFDKYYFLSGRDRIVKLRIIRKKFCQLRWKRARLAAKILQIVPFVRLVAVTNSLSVDNSNSNSDIDFFIITKKNRLWVARALTVMIMDLFFLNKSKFKTANQICLGFFIDTTRMNLFDLKSGSEMFLTYWLANMRPILDKKYFAKLISKNNWIYKNIPNYNLKKTTQILRNHQIKNNLVLSFFTNTVEFIMELFPLDWFEKIFRKIQINRIKKLEKEKLQVTKISKNIMYLGAYDKNQKYNHLAKKSYLRYFNE